MSVAETAYINLRYEEFFHGRQDGQEGQGQERQTEGSQESEGLEEEAIQAGNSKFLILFWDLPHSRNVLLSRMGPSSDLRGCIFDRFSSSPVSRRRVLRSSFVSA